MEHDIWRSERSLSMTLDSSPMRRLPERSASVTNALSEDATMSRTDGHSDDRASTRPMLGNPWFYVTLAISLVSITCTLVGAWTILQWLWR